MINWVIDFSVRNRFMIILFYVALAGVCYWALLSTPVDAIPDLSENQVIVFTDYPGRSPKEVEDQVTYPLTVNLQGLAGVRVVRSQSAFGFSMINIIFDDDTDFYFARTRVLEKLSIASSFLPAGVVPSLGPDATGVGQAYWYTVEGKGYDLGQLRAIQDFFVRYQLNAVPGVAEVASVGGYVRQYQVDVDPNALRAYGVTVGDVRMALERSNNNVGGKVIEGGGKDYVVRGLGLIGNMGDIESVVVAAPNGTPVYIRNIATVTMGPEFRRGALDKEGVAAVGGVVIVRFGGNTKDVIERVKVKIAELQPGLPEGVSIVPFYDRTDLIERAVTTLKESLIEEVILVTIAHILFLWHFRSILIVTLPLPLAILISFLFMKMFGVSSNIMSLGGIAIAIGVLVDAGIVVTENAMRFAAKTPDYELKIKDVVLTSAKLVGRPIFFSMAIIVLAFVPVFSLTGQEGKLFHPLAFTKTFALVGATLLAVTLTPVLCTFLIRGKIHDEADNRVMRFLLGLYRPALSFALRHRLITIGIALTFFVFALFLGSRIGSEFMPPLNEGTIMYMPVTDASISLTRAKEILSKQDEIIKRFPEVESVVGKSGRAETPTDPSPVNMTETIINLKSTEQWREGLTKDKLVSEMDAALQMPGVTNIWTQPIINRIDMLSTGIRTQVGIKVFGSDLKTLEVQSKAIANVVEGIRGAADVYPEQISGVPYLEIEPRPQDIARYGINIGDLQDVIETAIGGNNVTTTIEGRQRFPVRIRYARELRDTPEAIGRVLVSGTRGGGAQSSGLRVGTQSPGMNNGTPAPGMSGGSGAKPPGMGGGIQVPLSQIADIRVVDGPTMISSENGLLRGLVLLNVRGRDVGSFIEEAKRAVASSVKLPAGYYIEWSGQYENQIRAKKRLQIVIPMALAVTFLLLYLTYKSWIEAAHVLLAVPFALTGGVFLVYLLGYNFSVAVWVGFIALFGTATQTGMVMVVYLEEAVERKRHELGGRLTREGLYEAVMEGALLRLRPKVMTVSTVVAGLIPIMWSTKTGAEVMKPLATPVLGGMVSSLLHVLIVTPVIFIWLREGEMRWHEKAVGVPATLGTLDRPAEQMSFLKVEEGLAEEAAERKEEVSVRVDK
ncbi:MAG: efflux RND transporter permease subunit [Pyrinomonadaceae bacterium]|nr:efflux RND transporter permease subunit [Pyrinomonadaceae bacterium]